MPAARWRWNLPLRGGFGLAPRAAFFRRRARWIGPQFTSAVSGDGIRPPRLIIRSAELACTAITGA